MKPALYSLVAAALGFSLAWIVKPAPEPSKSTAAETRRVPRSTKAAAAAIEPEAPQSRAYSTPPPKIGPSPILSQMDHSAALQAKDEAKMGRLAEALNLSKEQQNSILSLIDQSREAMRPPDGGALDPSQTLEANLAMGRKIEAALAEILTPEQAAEFANFRKRAQQNTIESTAQSQLLSVAKQIDLSPEQRTKALEALRNSTEAVLSTRPPALALVVDSSVLPMGSTAISADSIEMMQQISASKNDLAAAHTAMMENQRARIDSELLLYQNILTPGQLAQLRTTLEERKQVIERVGSYIR